MLTQIPPPPWQDRTQNPFADDSMHVVHTCQPYRLRERYQPCWKATLQCDGLILMTVIEDEAVRLHFAGRNFEDLMD